MLKSSNFAQNDITRVVPDIRPFLYPVRYPVSFAGYPAVRITGYPARKTVYNQKQFWQIKLYHYISEIYITILYYFIDRIYYI